MIYLKDKDPKQHALRYNLKLSNSNCYNCGKEVQVNIPVISKDFAGFESEEHEPCGKRYIVSRLKPIGKFKEELNNL